MFLISGGWFPLNFLLINFCFEKLNSFPKIFFTVSKKFLSIKINDNISTRTGCFKIPIHIYFLFTFEIYITLNYCCVPKNLFWKWSIFFSLYDLLCMLKLVKQLREKVKLALNQVNYFIYKIKIIFKILAIKRTLINWLDNLIAYLDC